MVVPATDYAREFAVRAAVLAAQKLHNPERNIM